MNTNTAPDKNTILNKFRPFQINCGECCGLCCTALYFSRTDGFPQDKPAGEPCKNLMPDFRCSIHSRLSECNLKGCMAYDCFGAGQQVTRQLAGKPDWKSISRKEARTIFDSYLNVLQLHQVMWYLTEAAVYGLEERASSFKERTESLLREGSRLAGQPLDRLEKAGMDVDTFRERANALLKDISSALAPGRQQSSKAGRSKDFFGKNLSRKNLSGMDFSMAFLIAANLEQASVDGVNFLGADMRDTNIKNTDLRKSLFLTQFQINSAKGNQNTLLPHYLHRPSSW